MRLKIKFQHLLLYLVISLNLFASNAQQIQYSASFYPSIINVKEPTKLTILYKNISEVTQRFKLEDPELEFATTNGENVRYYPYRNYMSRIYYSPKPYLELKPNEVFRYETCILLGSVTEGNKWDDWKFVFSDAGEYRITISNYPDLTADIQVKESTKLENKKASDIFVVPAAKIILEDYEFPNRENGLDSLKHIIRKYAESIYAPYAALALVDYNWSKSSGKIRNHNYCKELLENILKKYSEFPFREKAYFRLAEVYSNQKSERHRVYDVLKRLSEEFPDSEYILKFKEAFGEELGDNQNHIKGQIIEGYEFRNKNFDIVNAGLLPDDVGTVFEKYWRGVFDYKLKESAQYIDNEEFFGVHGRLHGWWMQWQDFFKIYKMGSLEINVDTAEPVSFYVHQGFADKPSLGFKGELYLINATMNYTVWNILSGEIEKITEESPEMVLKKYEDGWKIVSEYRRPTRNQKAGYAAHKLYMQLKEAPDKARILKNSENIHIRKLILNEIGLKDDVDTGLEWRHLGITMEGDEFDKPNIHGVLQLSQEQQKRQEDGQDISSHEYKVVLKTVLRENGLELVSISADKN